MALVERLMHVDPDVSRHISVHSFFAACNEIVAGRLTVTQVKTFLQMDTADSAEFDAIVALTPGTAVGKAQHVNNMHSIFILAEGLYPGYSTPAEVRLKIGI